MQPFKSNDQNFLAIELLEKIGNDSPTQAEIDFVESILLQIPVFQTPIFDSRLTSQEVSCLYGAAMGKTAQEIADSLNIQPQAVEQHRKEIKKKLACKTFAQAIFKGMQLGYLDANGKQLTESIQILSLK